MEINCFSTVTDIVEYILVLSYFQRKQSIVRSTRRDLLSIFLKLHFTQSQKFCAVYFLSILNLKFTYILVYKLDVAFVSEFHKKII